MEKENDSIKGMTVRQFREMMQKEHPDWYTEKDTTKASATCRPEQKTNLETRTVTFTFIPDEKKFWEERKARAEARNACSKTKEEFNQ